MRKKTLLFPGQAFCMYAESLTIFAKIDLHGETSLRRKKNANPLAFHFVLHSLCTIF